ncbi:ABC transporter permease [Nocardia sp. NEAU-G5]|uniref:Transport permease protein n=1 Tax=Nocardia albiluteola TaxID=2842303 RepID=A0ABS6BAM7_9NOCA|nr:ABC transporter permease [Nocardia albiluteola]MBU3067353.1 ABC transporter permease [Nocardia albiluteola]
MSTVMETEATLGSAPLPIVEPRSERAASTLVRHSLIQCKRLLQVWARDPATTIQTLIYPALTLLMLRVVLGDSISNATGMPSVYGTVPMITVVAAMSGAVVSGLGFKKEQFTGLLGRFWTMPIHRAAGLTGRLLAEAIRVLITTLFVIVVGICIGFRFWNGPLAALGMIALPVLFGVAFAVLVTALATISEGVLLVNTVGIFSTLLMFFNSGFVPVMAYPTWLQSTVANQPMSTAIDAMRGLCWDGPITAPLLKTLAWTFGAIVIFAVPAIRGYRRAAESSG